MAVDRLSSPAHASRTSVRLAGALLGYFILVTLVITLSPFDFAARGLYLSLALVPSDMIANAALFLPIGFLLRSVNRSVTHGRWAAVSIAAGLSLLIEIAQIFIESRYVSPVDLATNTYGAFIGVQLRDRVERLTVWQPHTVGRIGLDIPLVGLLYLLVPQLWLSGVGLVDDPRRGLTTLLAACAAAIVLVALRQHHWPGGARFGERRFESETLRRFFPVFALYLTAAALWPPFRSVVPWHGTVGFSDGLNDAGVVEILLLLEEVGGFTLLGYALAEWRGRKELTLAADVPRVTFVALLFALSLELVQGVLAGPGASLLRALLATVGSAYGAAVYHLARSHVRALRAMEPRKASQDERDAAA